MYQLDYARYLIRPRKTDEILPKDFFLDQAELDMCKIQVDYDNELNPYNKGEDFIYLRPSRQAFLNAYPVSLYINPRASKRDVLDFVEKRWKWIEASQYSFAEGKKLKYGKKRKYSQELLDFIWFNRRLDTKKIEELADDKFPEEKLVYFEISKIIQLEKRKRIGS